MQAGVQRLVRAHERAALAFLARAPFENVFLTWLIVTDRSSSTRAATYVYVDAEANVRGVAFFGRQVVLAADNPFELRPGLTTFVMHAWAAMIDDLRRGAHEITITVVADWGSFTVTTWLTVGH